MPQIADTGFLVAFWNKADVHHRWARRLPVRAPLLTCQPVLAEADYLLGGQTAPLLQMLLDGDLVADFDMSLHSRELMQWMEKYEDLDPGLTDACVVRLAEITPRAEILTTDRRDFAAYRTLAGKPLHCAFPEQA